VRFPPVRTSSFALKGGLNQVTPPLLLSPGFATQAVNFDISSDGGYRRIEGYASYDGKVSSVSTVPGAGSILGIHQYNGKAYAFRNVVGNATAKMYVDNATTGWTEVDLGSTMAFTSGGVTPIIVGDTITGATSTKTAIVTRVQVTSGTWAGGDAAGTFTLRAQSGAFTAGENLNTGSGANLATATANATAVTLLPNGNYNFVNHNFGGSATTQMMFGCDGVNKAFQFDGTSFIQIATGMTTDTPDLVAVHAQHLFLSFGASVQHSSLGDPLTWSVVTGAGELAMGEDVTSMVPQAGDSSSPAMVITTRNSTSVLYGTAATTWNLVLAQPAAGAIADTMQAVGGRLYAFDDRGMVEVSRTIAYGNFDSAIVAREVLPWLTERKNFVIGSSVSRTDNQYRVHFSDGYSLYMTVINGQIAGSMPVYFPNAITCISSQEQSDGTERILFGSTDGYVYKIGGTSFNGVAISATLYMAFNHLSSPRDRKRYRRMILDVSGTNAATFNVGYALDYSSSEVEQGASVATATNHSVVMWDDFTWDSFTWDGAAGGPVRMDMTGTGYNVSIRIDSNTATAERFTFSGVTLHYTPRRLER
jgi:hypothetical protein